MEAISLLKYWEACGTARRTAVPVAGDRCAILRATTASSTSSAITCSDFSSDSDDEDNGPFFDLEFTLPDEIDSDEQLECEVNDEQNDESTESDESDGEDDSIDRNVSLSPSDDLFFKGRLVPLPDPNSKPTSAKKSTKFGVLMLKLKKSSKSKVSENADSKDSPKTPKKYPDEIERPKKSRGKFFTIKFRVTDDSSKDANKKARKHNVQKSMQRYLKKVKPPYIGIPKRYIHKLGLSGGQLLNLSGASKAGLAQPPPSTAVSKSTSAKKSGKAAKSPKSEAKLPKMNEGPRGRNAKSQMQVSLPARQRVVRNHLGKSKSAPPGVVASKFRDDHEDGIQSAIMHCKRSLKASRDLEA